MAETIVRKSLRELVGEIAATETYTVTITREVTATGAKSEVFRAIANFVDFKSGSFGWSVETRCTMGKMPVNGNINLTISGTSPAADAKAAERCINAGRATFGQSFNGHISAAVDEARKAHK